MLISRLGEFSLIERFKKSIKLDASVIIGSGDDCAVLEFDKSRYQLFTCDMLVQGVDFLSGTDPYLIGRKAIAVSISDIAACAGLPRHCLVSLGLPRRVTVAFADRLFKGMSDIAGRYKINLVGGDLSRSEKLILDISMLGAVEKDRLVLRSGARKGDIIFVTGKLGGSIRGKHLRFEPRIRQARFLVENYRINAMIDISDGLAGDLGHILKESRVGAAIYENLIPISKDARSFQEALYMGEDFELLFTLSLKEAKRLLKKNLNNFIPIGEITGRAYGLRLIDRHTREKAIQPKGYRHF